MLKMVNAVIVSGFEKNDVLNAKYANTNVNWNVKTQDTFMI